MIYFTSDIHFDHKNIIKFCDRNYSDIGEMNEDIVKIWNSTVKPQDTVYYVGDFSISSKYRAKYWIERLNGHKHLIKGNHDKKMPKDGWASVSDYKEIRVQHPIHTEMKQKIILFHYAMRVWNSSHYGSWQLYGHSHGELRDDPQALAIDVGWDVWKRPISLQEVAEIMSNKSWIPPFVKKQQNINAGTGRHDTDHHEKISKQGFGGYTLPRH